MEDPSDEVSRLPLRTEDERLNTYSALLMMLYIEEELRGLGLDEPAKLVAAAALGVQDRIALDDRRPRAGTPSGLLS